VVLTLQKVTPLNETSGVIEWVDNLVPLRTILQKLYREKFGSGVLMTSSELTLYATREDDREANRKNYDILVARHPPIFPEWFAANFPDPQTWYLARLGYTRTTAVMSMVGYLLGEYMSLLLDYQQQTELAENPKLYSAPFYCFSVTRTTWAMLRF
jgi:serine/threonine-protein kinase ATR